jgi:hypothetical protein
MMKAGPGVCRRTTSNPSPASERRTSQRTTSGFSRSMSLLAAAMSLAVPTTFMPDDFWISAASPSAIAG